MAQNNSETEPEQQIVIFYGESNALNEASWGYQYLGQLIFESGRVVIRGKANPHHGGPGIGTGLLVNALWAMERQRLNKIRHEVIFDAATTEGLADVETGRVSLRAPDGKIWIISIWSNANRGKKLPDFDPIVDALLLALPNLKEGAVDRMAKRMRIILIVLGTVFGILALMLLAIALLIHFGIAHHPTSPDGFLSIGFA